LASPSIANSLSIAAFTPPLRARSAPRRGPLVAVREWRRPGPDAT
jgi:hypothetical protein